MDQIIYQLKCVKEYLSFISTGKRCDTFNIEVLDGCISQLENKKYKEEIFAEWVIPVTKEPWKKGYFGLCTNCKGVNTNTEVAPLFCEKCGATMLNSTYNKKIR